MEHEYLISYLSIDELIGYENLQYYHEIQSESDNPEIEVDNAALEITKRCLDKQRQNYPSYSLNSIFQDKYIGLLFAGVWCCPCDSFVNDVILLYNFLNRESKKLEIIFISLDQNIEEYKTYFSIMPWLSLKYNLRNQANYLVTKFKIESVPSLIIMDSKGEIINAYGREKIFEDPLGEEFPWYHASIKSYLSNNILVPEEYNANGYQHNLEEYVDLNGKYIGVYFGAAWCSPCQKFAKSKLLDFYLSQDIDNFEIIFCSSDEDEMQFKSYLQHMPWLALPFMDPRTDRISQLHHVNNIPSLIIFDPNGKIVTKSARNYIEVYPQEASFPFYPKPIENLLLNEESYSKNLKECPSLIAFIENLDEEEYNRINNELLPHALQYSTKRSNFPNGPDLLFFVLRDVVEAQGSIIQRDNMAESCNDTAISQQQRNLEGNKKLVNQLYEFMNLKKYSNVNSTYCHMVILDLSDDGAFYVPQVVSLSHEVSLEETKVEVGSETIPIEGISSSLVTSKLINNFITQYFLKNLPKQQMLS